MRQRTITHFFDEEYRSQAAYVNFSKIPNIVSGSKVTAQKALSTIMSENINTWQKVEVIASSTALKTLYLGGSGNIEGVLTGIGSSYTDSNNMSLIETKGDFGGRLNNAAAAGRYIFAKKGAAFDKYFNKEDLNVLPRYDFEGQLIEYAYFTYNVPMILVNGTNGNCLGSGHSSDILPRNLEEIEDYLVYNLKGKNKKNKPFDIKPFFRGFNGTVHEGENPKQWIIKGTFKRLPKNRIEIDEVPIGENYKSYVKKLETLLSRGIIKDYEDLCDPKKDIFKFIIKHDVAFGKKSDDEIERILKLVITRTENYTLNDENNAITIFENVNDIFWHYYKIKMHYLQLRKDFMLNRMKDEITYDISKYVFIKAIVEDELIINKRKKADIEKDLEKISKIIKREDSYDYLLSMSISSLTEERMKKLMENIKSKKAELDKLKSTSLEEIWLKDLGR